MNLEKYRDAILTVDLPQHGLAPETSAPSSNATSCRTKRSATASSFLTLLVERSPL